ncbi:MAG: Flavin reductase [Actinoallomurus sp.]|nr:Flavin reductase [Actinoallomurus sp.]
MRLTVFGSTGRTGRQVLAEGNRRGHRITAFTRRPDTIADPSTLAAILSGDGRDPDAVRAGIAGTDAVIAIIAAPSRKGPHHIADVARTITGAMSETGVRRLVITSAYPIVGAKPRLPIALLKLVFADAYADGAAMEDLVSTSGLDLRCSGRVAGRAGTAWWFRGPFAGAGRRRRRRCSTPDDGGVNTEQPRTGVPDSLACRPDEAALDLPHTGHRKGPRGGACPPAAGSPNKPTALIDLANPAGDLAVKSQQNG